MTGKIRIACALLMFAALATGLVAAGPSVLSAAPTALPTTAVTPLAATVFAGSSSWITVSSPFSGDTNRNSYTTYEYSTSSGGPWTEVCSNGTPGESA